MTKQRIAILGSTGSIGTQSLDVIRAYPDKFEAEVLTACNNWELLARQAIEFQCSTVVIANENHYESLRDALSTHPIKVYAGADALEQVAGSGEIDVVISALVGYSGLFPTIRAIEAGKKVALANKETLVVAGETVMEMAERYHAPIIPVDSEHSAIFQCLVGERSGVEKLLLTSSGGPFLHTPAADFVNITPEDALRHPKWDMGAKITIDSATMMNKGFEVIEARWLFGVTAEQIEVVVHPETIIHSMVQFEDGAIKAQLGVPDMHLPIQYALTFPERMHIDSERFRFEDAMTWNFYKPDLAKFPNLALAYEALRRGGNAACVMNAANEVAVAAFLARKIGFMDINRVIERTMERASFTAHPSLADYRLSDTEAREIAASLSRLAL